MQRECWLCLWSVLISVLMMVVAPSKTHGIDAQVAYSDISIAQDRTVGDWSELAMGEPSNHDEADQEQNPQARISFVNGFGKPHVDAGARGELLPRLNDGQVAHHDDDPSNNVWFDTKGISRVLVDIGAAIDISRINVYSWHSGALSIWCVSHHVAYLVTLNSCGSCRASSKSLLCSPRAGRAVQNT